VANKILASSYADHYRKWFYKSFSSLYVTDASVQLELSQIVDIDKRSRKYGQCYALATYNIKFIMLNDEIS
jgi:hypothetical protein